MEGLGARSAAVRVSSAQELSRFLSDANRSQEFLYYDGMRFVPKLTEGAEKALRMAREQGRYDEGAIAACLAVAKVYSHEDEWEGLLEMRINLDPLVPSPQCLLELARAAAGPAAVARVAGIDDDDDDDDDDDEDCGKGKGKRSSAAAAAAAKKKRKKKKQQQETKKRAAAGQSDAVVTDERVLEGLTRGTELGFEFRWTRGLGARDAALMALLKVCKLHKIFLQARRTYKEGRVAAQAASFAKLVRVVREALLDELRKATSAPVMREDGSVAASASPLLAWRLGVWASIAETYSSVLVLVGAFEGNDHDIFMEEVMRACRGLLASFIAEAPWGEQALSPLLRVATNLTHENAAGCEAMNDQGLQLAVDMFKQLAALGTLQKKDSSKTTHANADADAVILGMDLDVDETEPDARSHFLFDSRLTLVGLLTNCVETNSQNRVWLSDHCGAFVDFFVSFLPREALAKLRRGGGAETRIEFGWTAEDLITCSYVCLLLGCLMRENKANQRGIKNLLPGGSLAIVMQVLEAFLAFQRDARVLSKEAESKTLEIMTELRGAELAEVASASSTSTTPLLVARFAGEADSDNGNSSAAAAGDAAGKSKQKKRVAVAAPSTSGDTKPPARKERRKVTIVEEPAVQRARKKPAVARTQRAPAPAASKKRALARPKTKSGLASTKSKATATAAAGSSSSSSSSTAKALFSLDDVMG